MNLGEALRYYLTPKEAQAEVVPADARAERLLGAVTTPPTTPQNEVAQGILATAMSIPQQVTVYGERNAGTPPGMYEVPGLMMGTYGRHHEPRIDVAPQPAWSASDTVAHEMLHFLIDVHRREHGGTLPPAEEHAVIPHLLSSDHRFLEPLTPAQQAYTQKFQLWMQHNRGRKTP